MNESPTPGQPGQQPNRAVAAPPQGSMAQPGAGEQFYSGTAAHSASLGAYIKWSLVFVAAGAAAIGIHAMDWGVAGWMLGLGWMVLGVPGLVWTYLTVISSKYKITARRVETEHGVLAKKVDSLELWRVLDVEYGQSVLDRMFNNGRIKLISTDQTNPELILHGLPDHRKLFELLRDAVQAARHTNRPMELVPGHDFGGDAGDIMQ